ncbi:MAG: 16S rRNA (guanine(527)-N(7))-methyltransferase RsmG [gamma proteobacterium symbiont of Lucinoma myriamae]|nr:16S rRNA (guanine(527)-N(7))-methyltransferase RsmG [gamma proteobacterium symbiont of Lucinoma myriamae]MCU7819379.1 16S rRNA (guanine(527)-N(7))-methyltransferase RsmG [gamma proteobacterium symbiont of Lucinoma myriamae]MCU7831406.1 16S rRNA (guanine(527)-N(7))-methyltransferase RsmG [gamma proteobacterium symbiont of Lucinoma myriamae]
MSSRQILSQSLADGIRQQGQIIAQSEQDKLIYFVELLNKWNKVYNLTSIRKPAEMISLHLLDALVMLPFFDNSTLDNHEQPIKRVLDVGTGGGIPGIPLAICLPDIDFVLMDARGKKVRFIQTAIAQLGLKNVTAVHSRVEAYQVNDEDKFDRIISRAFASLEDMLMFCRHLCRRRGRKNSQKQGKFFAMKGQIPEEEIAQLPEGFRIEKINELKVSGLNAQRHLIQIAFS